MTIQIIAPNFVEKFKQARMRLSDPQDLSKKPENQIGDTFVKLEEMNDLVKKIKLELSV